jgi:hypothetical protein
VFKNIFYSCIIALFLDGCSVLTTLPDGQPSAMDDQNNRIRSQLAITASPLGASLKYHPVKNCSYDDTENQAGIGVQQFHIDVSVKPVRNRLLITANNGKSISDALITPTGKLLEFNLTDDQDNTHTTPETYQNRVDQTVAKLDPQYYKGLSHPHALNNFSLKFPEYSAPIHNPGDIAAVIIDEANEQWGAYRYRGVTQIDGTTAAVLDITRVFPDYSERGPSLVGFELIDLRTMLPVLFVMQGVGFEVRMQRSNCTL